MPRSVLEILEPEKRSRSFARLSGRALSQPAKFHDDWLITGDVAKIDEDQYLMIADRFKDMVKSGGEWISSVDLENHIVGMAGVTQAVVVAQPDTKWDEGPLALVILGDEASLTCDEILEHCAEAFGRWQLSAGVLFGKTTPLTSTGTIDKKVIRANLAKDGYQLPDLCEEGSGA